MVSFEILLITLLQLICFVALYPLSVIKYRKLLFIVVILVSPSIALFDTDIVFLKQPLSILIIFLLYFFNVIFNKSFRKIHLINPVFKIYKLVVFIISLIIISSLTNLIFSGFGKWDDHRDFFLMILTFLFLFVLVTYYSNQFSKDDFYFFISKLIIFFVVFSSFLAICTYLNLFGFRGFHYAYYNFSFVDESFNINKLLSDDDSKSSVFSTFSSQNQFGSFGSLCLLISTFLFKNGFYTKLNYSFITICLIIIVFTSESRTALITFLLILFLIKFISSRIIFVFIIPLLIIIGTQFIDFLPERVLMLFSNDADVSSLAYNQRFYFWEIFVDFIKSNPYSLFVGIPKSDNFVSFFESGFLNMISRGGIIGLYFYMILMSFPLKYLKHDKNTIYLKIFFYLIFFLEISQGVWLSFRMNFFFAIVFSLILFNQSSSKLLNSVN
jgi:hypothetical protein